MVLTVLRRERVRGIEGLQPRTPKGFYLPVGEGLRLDFPGRRCARMSHSSGVGQTACLVIGFAERCFLKVVSSLEMVPVERGFSCCSDGKGEIPHSCWERISCSGCSSGFIRLRVISCHSSRHGFELGHFSTFQIT